MLIGCVDRVLRGNKGRVGRRGYLGAVFSAWFPRRENTNPSPLGEKVDRERGEGR